MKPLPTARARWIRASSIGLVALAVGLGIWLWRRWATRPPVPDPGTSLVEGRQDQGRQVTVVESGTGVDAEPEHRTHEGSEPHGSSSERAAREHLRQWAEQERQSVGRGSASTTVTGNPQPPAPISAAEGEKASLAARMLVIAQDLEHHPLSGVRFSCESFVSDPTNAGGATWIDLPQGYSPGNSIQVLLLASREWFLINSQVNVPDRDHSAALVLVPRSMARTLFAEARDAPRLPPGFETSRQAEASLLHGPVHDWLLLNAQVQLRGAGERPPVIRIRLGARRASAAEVRGATNGSRTQTPSTTDDAGRALAEAAARHGLTGEQLSGVVAWFSKTSEQGELGIALYVEGRYPEAELALRDAIAKRALAVGEAFTYLGVTQFEQAKYEAAVEAFQDARGLGVSGPALLDWLGRAYFELGEWDRVEVTVNTARGQLTIHSSDPSESAHRRDNFDSLLETTTKLRAGERHLRQTLQHDESVHGLPYATFTSDLSKLGLLLAATNRAAEAEQLMRRALSLDEERNSPKYIELVVRLNNLGLLLESLDRPTEAEPYLRQALSILFNWLHMSSHDHPYYEAVRENYVTLLRDMGRSQPEIDAAIASVPPLK